MIAKPKKSAIILKMSAGNKDCRLKQDKKALETISEGLRHLPDSKGLQRRYKALGGKLPYPAPIGKPLEKVLPQSSEKIEQPSGKHELTKMGSVVPPPPVPMPLPEISTPEDTKRNPWCRFCP